MALDQATVAELAQLYFQAEHNATPLEPVSRRYPDADEEDAYRVQAALIELKIALGRGIVGRKGGATNPGAQAAFGLSQAVYATLFDHGAVVNGGVIELSELIHPRLECEVAFRLGADLRGPGQTPESAAAAVAELLAAFEVVDARTVGWQAKMLDMIADNVFQARYVLGDQGVSLAGIDPATITVTLLHNGESAAQASGANVLGSPLNALAWLANRMADHGAYLRAGDLVLAGSLTPLTPIAPGDRFEAVFDHLGSVRVSFV
ncbi:MAG: 2-keto-4-pentenoate hydratase [Oscillochloris sp.]|nr:2-keto-4-pentenoate hydratase [Oscillochloris sp.]